MRPLDPLSSIKMKLGVVIVAAVSVTVLVVSLGVNAGYPLLLLGVVAGALALAMVQLLARGMTSPLREMAAAARAMAKGDYDRRVAATSRDEVGELARAFNRMAADLAEVDRVRRDLVANVSHELRTPIGALQAALENMVDGVEATDPETLKTMLVQVERLGHLVAQLLDLSRLESGASPLQRSRVALRPLIEQTLDGSRLHAQHVDLVMDVPAELTIEADPIKLHQVVANLVENAIRHSPEGGKVRVKAEMNGALRLEVTDEGPGVPEDERSRIFERFYRSDRSRTKAQGGAGLGLAIARWIVEQHGGDITVEDATPTGCKMIVRLPATGQRV